MQELRIDPEFRDLIPPLAPDEYAQLEANIIADGCRDALVVWSGTIADGHNRYKICTEHSIPFKTENKEFPDREAVIQWIILNQFGRRNLSAIDRVKLAERLKPIIQEKAKERQGTRNDLNIPPILAGSSKPSETRDELARLAGVSHGTYEKAASILKEGTPEQVERARQGGKGNSVNAVYHEIHSESQPEYKVCTRCGRNKPTSDFDKGRNVCKECRTQAGRGRPMQDLKGNRITSNPETDELFRIYGEQVLKDITDLSTVPEFTIEDFVNELNCTVTTFEENAESCLSYHKELLSSDDNRKQILDVLRRAEGIIKSLKGKLA